MNVKETKSWLNCFKSFGIQLGLDRIQHILQRLGNPEKAYDVVHVGGTNGKGTVCRLLTSIFYENGYHVGMYTSPHLQVLNERYVVDNSMITDLVLARIISKIRPIVEDMVRNGETPTYFEVCTAIAFQYFYEKKVDIVVIEVGLGGRYDATNVVIPLVSVITNVSLEHQHILGDTIEKIAFEKAGIIKKDTPVVTAARNSALQVIKKVSEKQHAPLHVVENKKTQRIHAGASGQKFHIKGMLKDYVVETPMLGMYQGENISIALATVEQLQMKGVYLTDENILQGIKNTVNPGRMEIVSYDPVVLLDGAHNPAGAELLSKTLVDDFCYSKLILIFGVLRDKNIRKMLSVLLPLAHQVILTEPATPRACNALELTNLIRNIDSSKQVMVKKTVTDALKLARSLTEEKDLICVTGSLFTVGEARSILLQGNTF